jgi:hypothetical protein
MVEGERMVGIFDDGHVFEQGYLGFVNYLMNNTSSEIGHTAENSSMGIWRWK